MSASDGTPNRPKSSAERGRAYRARQKATAALCVAPDIPTRIAALESDLASVRAELLSLRARVASERDLEAELVWYRTVALAALAFVAAVVAGCRRTPAASPTGAGNWSSSRDRQPKLQ